MATKTRPESAATPAAASAATMKHLYLVDGSGYIFRAFHALPPLTRPDGTPVGAVLGFTNMLWKLLGETDATISRSSSTPRGASFRNEMYDEYKANRPPPPDDLIPQFPLIREATRAFGVPAIELDGYRGRRPDRLLCPGRRATAGARSRSSRPTRT